MRNILILEMAISSFLFLFAVAAAQNPQSYPGYTLIWSDEFEGNSLDGKNWSYDTGFGDVPGDDNMNGWGVGGLQNYSDSPDNVTVSNGMLHLQAIYKGGPRDGRNYTSGKIHTRDKRQFCFGIITARIKFPSGAGIFPAFWMLGTNNYYTNMNWPDCGEIDIVEEMNSGKVLNAALHWFDNIRKKHSSTGGQFQVTNINDFYRDFHTYQIIWTPAVITWKVDNRVFAMAAITPESMAALRKPMYIILNFGVGSHFSVVGYPDETTVFPQTMDVDWVRVYQKKK